MVALKEKPAFREANQQLLDEIDRKWINQKLQEPICGWVVLVPGKAAALTLKLAEGQYRGEEGKGIQAVVYGQEVQAAQNQPMSKETVGRQMKKTGNSPFIFRDLTVAIEGDVFLPLQALNELRRKGLEELERQVLSACYRKARDAGRSENRELGNNDRESREELEESPFLAVSVEEQHQLGPVLAREEIKEIYVDADGFPAQVWAETAAACRREGKACFLLMPEIFRREAAEYFRQNKEQLARAGFDGLVVRNLEEVEWWREEGRFWLERAGGKMLSLIFDASLYTWNRRAVKVMEEAGAARIVVPAELNVHELKERGVSGQELLVYGRLPMMVSAQCVQKTVLGCSHRRGKLRLKDRTGKELPVKNRCRFCYNTIYNASPVSLLGQEKLVEDLRPAVLRLHFTDETPEEVESILNVFIGSFYYHRAEELPLADFTRGHFKRGVE